MSLLIYLAEEVAPPNEEKENIITLGEVYSFTKKNYFIQLPKSNYCSPDVIFM
jgi:hypothetical protein